MKTFEEAAAVILITRPCNEDTQAEEMSEARKVLTDTRGRYAELATEVSASTVYALMSFCWLELGASDPSSAIMSAFMGGLIVGIEMEKQDTL